MTTTAADREKPPVLRATANDVRRIASLLRPIAFTKICQVIVSEAGLQVSTELDGVLQATSYIGCGMFDKFVFTPPGEDRTFSSSANSSDVDDDEPDSPLAMFDVSLDMWLTCLNIYGTATGGGGTIFSASREAGPPAAPLGREGEALRKMPFARNRTFVEMTYEGKGHPLKLDIRENRVKTQCELATFETNTVSISNMPYLPERTVGQVIMYSKELTEALMSIDSSCRNVVIDFSDGRQARLPDASISESMPDLPRTPTRRQNGGTGVGATALAMTSQISHDHQPGDITDTRAVMGDRIGCETMRISAVGDVGSTEIDFPNSSKVFESFYILYPTRHTFSFTNIQHCFRALQTSLKVSIRIDDQGMMSMQCLFPDRPTISAERDGDRADENAVPEKRGFVEIRLLPAVTDDDLS